MSDPPRSVADQTTSELGGAQSLLVRQRRDHAELERLLHLVKRSHGRRQDDVLLDLYRLVFPHAFAEESVLWPVVRRELDGGEELTVRNEQEHQQINELVRRLERTSHDDPQRSPLIDQVSALLRQDARDEEDLILPRLQAKLDARELRRLGRRWDAVRRVAPTRAHPVVARRPPGNVAAALPLTLVDRLRDRLDRLSATSLRAAPVTTRLSRGLAVLAAGIEHVPPLTRGEHPSTSTRR